MDPTLRTIRAARLLPVCCLHPAVGERSGVQLQYAARHPGLVRCRWHAGPVGRGRLAVDPREAGCERADAGQPDHRADIGHRTVGIAQRRRGPFQASGLQVGPWGFAEGAGGHPAEVRPGQTGRRGQVVDGDRLGVAGVDEVLGPHQVPGRWNPRHHASMALFRNRRPTQYVVSADELAGRPRLIVR